MIILASASKSRISMLQNAGIAVLAKPAKVDEESVKQSLLAENANPRDICDALAELKAQKIADKHPDSLVLGCDQVLECQKTLYNKPNSPAELRQQLVELRGKTHKLLSAAVLYENAKPVWRFVSEARLTMHQFSDAYLDDYIARNYDEVRHCVGGYQIESEGVRLFSQVTGDHFTILGMPLIPFLSYLSLRGEILA